MKFEEDWCTQLSVCKKEKTVLYRQLFDYEDLVNVYSYFIVKFEKKTIYFFYFFSDIMRKYLLFILNLDLYKKFVY